METDYETQAAAELATGSDLQSPFYFVEADKPSESRNLEWLYRADVLGETGKEIAQSCGYSPSTVCRGLQAGRELLKGKLAELVADVKLRSLLRLDYLYGEVTGQWRESKDREAVRRTEKESARTGGEEAGEFSSTETETRHELGDPRYVAEARQIIAEQLKIVGGYAPKKTEHTGDPTSATQINVAVANLTPEQLDTVRQATRLVQAQDDAT